MPTDYTFTGQKFDASAGLMYYGARYYDATLGRSISADTVVPSAANPQALNRYAYTLNNPVKYTDPTGQRPCGDGYDEDCNGHVISLAEKERGIKDTYDVTVEPGFRRSELDFIIYALWDISTKIGGIPEFIRAFGGARFELNTGQLVDANGELYAGFLEGTIYLPHDHFLQAGLRKDLGPRIGIAHELAHYWDWTTNDPISRLLNLPGTISSQLYDWVCSGGECEGGPSWYSRTSMPEGWAESFAMFVYPEYADILIGEKNPLENPEGVPGKGGPGLGRLHRLYVEYWIGILH